MTDDVEALAEVLTDSRCDCGHDLGHHHIDTGCTRCPCSRDMPEAEAVAILTSPWLAAHVAAARAEEREAALAEVRALADADRALWGRLADEVDAYLTADVEEGLFG